MLGVVKGLMITALGIGGVGGAVYGITKVASSSSASKSVKKELSSSGPLLVCGEGQGPSYEIDLGLDENSVDLKVWKVEGANDSQKKTQIKVGVGSEIFQLLLSRHHDTKINRIKVRTLGDASRQRNGTTITCSVTKIDSVRDHTGNLTQNDIDIQLIELTVNPCKLALNKPNQKECEIRFRKEDHLKWTQDFQPKVTYTTV